MAYNSEWLLKYYYKELTTTLVRLEAKEFAKSPQDRIRQLSTFNIFDPCIYLTLFSSIYGIPEKLNRIKNKFYAKIFDYAATALNTYSVSTRLNNSIEQVCEKATQWNVQEEFLKTLYSHMESWKNILAYKNW
jgi:NADH dehydrogenase FAD-containing subunit